MRRLCLILLCGLVAVPAALAAARATGDGVLELNGATGTIVLTGTRGTVWGQVDKGKLVVTAGDGVVYVSGGEARPGLNDNVTVYTGKNLHFRVTGGKYKLVFRGIGTDTSAVGVDLTAVGVGVVQLAGDAFADSTGKYAVDDNGKWNTVPVWTTKIPFGVQPPTAP